jgi:hypothetical protein
VTGRHAFRVISLNRVTIAGIIIRIVALSVSPEALIVFAIVMVVYQQVENYIAADDHRKAAQVSGREMDQ